MLFRWMMSGSSWYSSALTHIWRGQRAGEKQTCLSEGAEARKDGAANPCAVFSLGGGKDLDLDVLDGEAADLREEAVAEACVC
ncbi:hypothetical protein PMAC_001490 [Pneumocystis sp. 'macacae']|nr:hypothetical protein PMAC_001490 [Pneumocystis sp. 'macacae']